MPRRVDPTTGKPAEPLTHVGANLLPEYSRKLAYVHAATGRRKQELLMEAIDLLFAAHSDGKSAPQPRS